ncbi:MAG TPA: carboxypeptidase-like regulatory domain-containing protein [Planctomicrobium sp.]|nr:carboxypeptidase-like regulatory domain-containing protein [Planctomicrobium sp.]
MMIQFTIDKLQNAILCFVFLVFLSGCGSRKEIPIASVSGIVTYQEKPVTQGDISFMSNQGFGASAQIDSDGRYSLRSQYGKGIPLGTYKVIVTPPPILVNESENPRPQVQEKTHPEIPKKYRHFSTSELEIEIGEKPVTFNINMEPA